MKKHYFLQNLTTSTIYHLDLSEFYSYVDYCSILARIFRIKDIDLSCRLSNKNTSLDFLAYNILVYSFAFLTGYNKKSSSFKSIVAFIGDNLTEVSLIGKSIQDLKHFYKIFKSDNFYGINSFKNSSNHNGCH